MTAVPNAAREATIARVEANLVSGAYFRLIARASRSVPLGGPPIRYQSYGGAMTALARFASMGDWGVSVAHPAMTAVNPYQTAHEVRAQIAESLGRSAAEGYYDVIGATGPEPGRPSSHRHPTTLRRALLLAILMSEVDHGIGPGWLGSGGGVGWVLKHLILREGVPVYASEFPHVAKALAGD